MQKEYEILCSLSFSLSLSLSLVFSLSLSLSNFFYFIFFYICHLIKICTISAVSDACFQKSRLTIRVPDTESIKNLSQADSHVLAKVHYATWYAI